ncbi:hypothetical protein NQ318_017779 [Aromia moschata]|uniref:Peptidase S1 domain-containing protein n=1 Tax=Aromia moschata TaxID=1265417 RepID=A0AAV8XVM1_9CUCU|nr:hypothetical protein NQ318_017779 [Aromia moschata]
MYRNTDTKGHCKHLTFCRMDVLGNSDNKLEYLCVIEKPVWNTSRRSICNNKDDRATRVALDGSLVSDKTTGTRLVAADIRVRLSEYDFGSGNETRSRDFGVAKIIEHEEFVLSTYRNDIAIVVMDKPTSFNTYIWPLSAAGPRELRERNGRSHELGQTYYAGPTSEVLLQVAVPVWPHQKCVDAFLQRINDDNICAAGYEGKDSCLVGGPEEACVTEQTDPKMLPSSSTFWMFANQFNGGTCC